ncbi:MAG TPA: ABC transporter substrate-binding protein [Acidimicrobiales bacterium]|nr:ABC transporter substrate-binding protein [Acidimicrobiales bacterium]
MARGGGPGAAPVPAPAHRPWAARHLRGVVAAALLVLFGVLVTLAGTSGNAPVSRSTSGNTAGVFPHRIVIGGLASVTGPLPAMFAPVFDGVTAYVDMVNAEGGVNGRRIVFSHKLDDQSSPSLDAAQARALVDQYHVFAVVGVATPSFTGAGYLASHDVPTFGLNVNPNSQWGAGPSMFGNTGSYTDFTSPQLQAAFLAEQHHVRAAAVISYSIAEAQQGCQTAVSALHRYGIPVAVDDLNVPVPVVDLHADVSRIKASGADFVIACMDLSGNVLLSDTMAQEGVTGVTQYWFNGYDEAALAQFASSMQGVYLLLQHVPFEVAQLDPGVYPGMDRYEAMLKRYVPGASPSEASLAGWWSADLFVTGLRSLGRHVTRSGLVHTLNQITDFTADGIVPPMNWTFMHDPVTGSINCTAFVVVRDGHFVPVYGVPPSVFSCFPVPAPAGPPVDTLSPLPSGIPPLPPTPGSNVPFAPTP